MLLYLAYSSTFRQSRRQDESLRSRFATTDPHSSSGHSDFALPEANATTSIDRQIEFLDPNKAGWNSEVVTTSIDQQLAKIAESHPDVTRRLRAIWTLHVIDRLTPDRLERLVTDGNEYVRCWAIQLELEDRAASTAMVDQLTTMADNDSSPIVRLYLAAAMQRMPLE